MLGCDSVMLLLFVQVMLMDEMNGIYATVVKMVVQTVVTKAVTMVTELLLSSTMKVWMKDWMSVDSLAAVQ